MTPRLLTWGGWGGTVELSIVRKNLSVLARVDLEPTKRNSVLSLFSFKKLEENQDLISSKSNQIKSSFIYKSHLKAIFGRAKVLYM